MGRFFTKVDIQLDVKVCSKCFHSSPKIIHFDCIYATNVKVPTKLEYKHDLKVLKSFPRNNQIVLPDIFQ